MFVIPIEVGMYRVVYLYSVGKYFEGWVVFHKFEYSEYTDCSQYSDSFEEVTSLIVLWRYVFGMLQNAGRKYQQ